MAGGKNKQWATQLAAHMRGVAQEHADKGLPTVDVAEVTKRKPQVLVKPIHDDIVYEEEDLLWAIDKRALKVGDSVLLQREPSDQPIVVALLDGNDPDPTFHPKGKALKNRVGQIENQSRFWMPPSASALTLAGLTTDANGTVRLNLATNELYRWDADLAEWVAVSGGGGGGGASDLDDLTDVTITGPITTGSLLRYNGTQWVNWVHNFLDTTTAASTYLTIANAASTYLTIANAASTYSPLGHTHAAANITYAGSTNLAAANVEAALDELDTEKVGIYGATMNLDAGIGFVGSTTGVPLVTARVSGDANPRVQIDSDGLQFGNGTSAPDVRLRHGSALSGGNTNFVYLASGDSLRILQDPVNADDVTRKVYVDTAISTAIAAIPSYTGTTNRITVSSGVIDIAATYVGQTSITTLGTITTGTWNATNIAYNKLTLTNSIVNADIASGAAIAYSKLNLASSIVNADVAAAAAIAVTKLALGGANTVLQSNGTTNSFSQITDAHVATANKDGVAGTASMRTLGTGAQQAAAGNHTHAFGSITGTIAAGQYGAGSIVDADISASAAIAQSKVANLTSDLALKAPLASPALTGTPTVPTAAPGTNTTQAASTAFVTGALASYLTTATAASTYMPLAGGTFTGNVATSGSASINMGGSGTLWLNTHNTLRMSGRLQLRMDEYSSSSTIGMIGQHKLYTGTGGHTLTLPTLSGSTYGTIWIENIGTGTVTIARASTNTINIAGTTGQTSFTVAPGEVAMVVHRDSGSTEWVAVKYGVGLSSLEVETLVAPLIEDAVEDLVDIYHNHDERYRRFMVQADEPTEDATGVIWIDTDDNWDPASGVYLPLTGGTLTGPLITSTFSTSTGAGPGSIPGWLSQLTGDINSRARIGLDSSDAGALEFGPGNSTRDWKLSRTGADEATLATGDTLDMTLGTAKVATQTQGDNSTKAASTAYVDEAMSNAGGGDAGTDFVFFMGMM